MKRKSPGRKRSESENPRLTTRQRRFLAEKVQGKSDRQAALDAGYAPSTAENAGQKIYGKESVQAKFVEILERAGISDTKLARRLREGIDAKETKFFVIPGDDGLKKIVTRNVVHYGERRAYVEIALKLKGHLIDKHEIVGKLSVGEILAASFLNTKTKSDDERA